ncbi:uncharacterized protein LOC123499914 [Portunus trituberculatus]|uniref:uncharacterized protein LOC123499914 n=1 Tax=Portunus trituberculatus TaxID=210409 RepID=UPI001E1CE7A9|nr:uncharacterized protein LOC123499914 [Portunus trituberculatus]
MDGSQEWRASPRIVMKPEGKRSTGSALHWHAEEKDGKQRATFTQEKKFDLGRKRIVFGHLGVVLNVNVLLLPCVKCILFIAEHCSLRVVDHLSELCKVRFADSKGCKDFKLKRTKCSAIVCNVLAPHFSSDLKDDIGDQKFSLLIDESNDITVTKLLGIAIRFYSRSKKKIVVTFLDLVELPDCDSTGICDALKRSLKNSGLELQKLTAIGTDNASVMTGVNSGVYAKLKTEVPHLILIKCVCHSLQLAVSHATAQCLPRNLDFLIKETYNWFSHSAIRQARYKEIFSLINDGQAPLKLIHLSQTRWLSVESAIVRILQQWLELKTHFGMARHGEKCYTAEILYGMFCDKENYAFLVFLKHILGEVQRVNKKFEAEVQDPTKLLSDLLHLIDSMKSKVLIPEHHHV